MKGGCNKNPGPGPGAYLLPSTVGYKKHDSTRDRRPAYSMGQRQIFEFKSIGPGPDFMVEKYNRFGSTKTPAYTMATHLKPLKSCIGTNFGTSSGYRGEFCPVRNRTEIGTCGWCRTVPNRCPDRRTIETASTPGPGTYCPEKWRESAPAFSLLQRLPPSSNFKTPAPNAYNLPSCLNGTMQNLGMRLGDNLKDCSPGPAHYSATNLDVHRWQMPKYSIAQRTEPPSDRSQTPGPNTYLPGYTTHRNPPKFSFGVKHTDCEYTPFTDADKYPPGCP